MIEITAHKNENGRIYFEATECGSILEWDYCLKTLLHKLSEMTPQFEQDLIDNM